jgi:hypothetical protein
MNLQSMFDLASFLWSKMFRVDIIEGIEPHIVDQYPQLSRAPCPAPTTVDLCLMNYLVGYSTVL